MKKLLLVLCSVALMGSALQAEAKEKQKNVFPDGTPISEWFLDDSVPELASLGKVYNLADYGVISDPVRLQTEKVQAVIDEAAANGGGVVVFPEGICKSGALFMRQGVNIHLKQGAILLGSDSILDFPVVMTRIEGEYCKYFAALINAENLDGFSITGKGIIDGNGSPYWQAFRTRRLWNPQCTNKDEQRPRLVFIHKCTNVTVADVTLQNSPFWSFHCYKSDHVKVLNVRIFSPVKPIRSASADGIDMDVCNHFLIKGCRLTVNDDAVCFKGGKGPDADKDGNNGPNYNILIEDTLFDNTTGSCMTCGSESIHAYNILMRNCRVEGGGSLLQLKMRPDTPQRYEYITIENVTGWCSGLLNIAPWTQFFDLKGHTEIPRSYSNNITMRNLELKCNRFIGAQRNKEQYDVYDFTFENINVEADDARWNSEAFDSYVMKNVTVNGEKQQ